MSRLPAWALAVPGIAIAAVPLLIGLQRGPTLDASVFAVIAEEMRRGGVPYRDFFDHKPPVIYLAEWSLGVAVPFLDAWTRAWALTVAGALGTLALLAWKLSPARSIGTVLALAALGPLLGAEYFAQGGGQTESLAVLPATAGFLLAAGEQRPLTGRSMAAGVLLGIGGATSFQVAPVALGALACLIVAGGGVRAAAAFLAGGSIVALLILSWLALVGALPAALEQLLVYNRAYLTGQSFLHPIPLLNVAVAALILSPLVSAVAVRLTELVVRRDGDPAEVGSAVAILAWAALVVMQGQFIGHYAIVLAAPLAILGVPVFNRLRVWLIARRTRLLAILAMALSIAFPVIVIGTTEHGPAPRPPIHEASSAIERHVQAGSSIFIWGNEPYPYLLTRTRPAGPFTYLFPLTKAGYTTAAMVRDLLGDWERQPPAAIVDASYHPRAASSHPLLGPWHLVGPLVPDELDPLREFVRERYRVAATIDDWTIYVPN